MSTDVLHELRALRHVATCATGSRAETRGPCNCGAADKPAAWIVQLLRETDPEHTPLLRVLFPADAITRVEALALRDALEEAAYEASRIQAKWFARHPQPPRVAHEQCPRCSSVLKLLADCDRCEWKRTFAESGQMQQSTPHRATDEPDVAGDPDAR